MTLTEEQKKRLVELLRREYLTEDERDELDMLIAIKKSDPDFNIDEYMNNR